MLLGREVARRYGASRGIAVLALPRGGVPVGYEVARAIDAPLDVLVVRKLALPGQPELTMGALAGGGVCVLNHELIHEFGVSASLVEHVVALEQAELARRERTYRGSAPPTDVRGRPVIIVDDALATGTTMRAAVLAARQRGVASVVVAAPVGARDTCQALARVADDVVCLVTPETFHSVGRWYDQFPQLDDEDVRAALRQARQNEADARRTASALATIRHDSDHAHWTYCAASKRLVTP